MAFILHVFSPFCLNKNQSDIMLENSSLHQVVVLTLVMIPQWFYMMASMSILNFFQNTLMGKFQIYMELDLKEVFGKIFSVLLLQKLQKNILMNKLWVTQILTNLIGIKQLKRKLKVHLQRSVHH